MPSRSPHLPTVAQVEKMTPLRGMKIVGEDQREVIVPGDWCVMSWHPCPVLLTFSSVFIVYKGIDLSNHPDSGRPYWKGLVKSIHLQNETTSLLIVAWFYDPDDVYDELVPNNIIDQE